MVLVNGLTAGGVGAGSELLGSETDVLAAPPPPQAEIRALRAMLKKTKRQAASEIDFALRVK